ncbi:MAG: hypothetical protein ACE5GG_05245 [Candidatus Omnitrophota bacterium]
MRILSTWGGELVIVVVIGHDIAMYDKPVFFVYDILGIIPGRRIILIIFGFLFNNIGKRDKIYQQDCKT